MSSFANQLACTKPRAFGALHKRVLAYLDGPSVIDLTDEAAVQARRWRLNNTALQAAVPAVASAVVAIPSKFAGRRKSAHVCTLLFMK